MKFMLDFGREIDLLTKSEVAQVLAERDTAMRAELAGKKYRPRVRLSGYAVGGVLDIGGDTILDRGGTLGPAWNGQPVGPNAGYAWAIRRMVVSGLTPSATAPDVVNFAIHGSGSGAQWQLNGNSFGQTFSWGEMVIEPGESLRIFNQGAFTAAGLITLWCALVQVPAERLGELV
jgi:hypothetical protein